MDGLRYDPANSPTDDDDLSADNLSELSNEAVYFENKIIYQRKALFAKCLAIQKRSKMTNFL